MKFYKVQKNNKGKNLQLNRRILEIIGEESMKQKCGVPYCKQRTEINQLDLDFSKLNVNVTTNNKPRHRPDTIDIQRDHNRIIYYNEENKENCPPEQAMFF